MTLSDVRLCKRFILTRRPSLLPQSFSSIGAISILCDLDLVRSSDPKLDMSRTKLHPPTYPPTKSKADIASFLWLVQAVTECPPDYTVYNTVDRELHG